MGNRSDTVRLLEVGLLAWAILAIAHVGQARCGCTNHNSSRAVGVGPASKRGTNGT